MAEHTDSFAGETQHSTQETVSEFEPFNADVVGDRTVRDLYEPDTLALKKPLIVALARTNRRDPPPDSDADSIDAAFDEAVCEVALPCYELADLEDPGIPDRHLRALLLQTLRGLSTFNDLQTYIDAYADETLSEFGLKRAYDQSTYRKARNELHAARSDDVVARAARIAANALFANGAPIPPSVKRRYTLSIETGADASAYPPEARDIALYTIVGELLDIVVKHLDFGRGDNASRELISVVGAFAWSAMDEKSVDTYHQRARHTFDLSTALKGPTIRGHIDSLSFWKVNALFDDINQALLTYVADAQGLTDPITSYDLTDIQSPVAESDSHPYRTEDGRWRVASLAITDPALEFAVGTRILRSNATRAAELEKLLRELTANTEVGLLMADRGFDGEDDITACRTFADDWLIFAQDYSDQRRDDFARLRENLDPGGTAVIEDAGYEKLSRSVTMIGVSGASEESATVDPVCAFYTDSLSADPDADSLSEAAEAQREDLIRELTATYQQRAKIETMFGMAKNDLDVGTDSSKTTTKTFYVNMAMLFYNLYNIVNTVPAPNSGLELDTSQKELLNVIQNIAFHGPEQPVAQTHLQTKS